MAMAWVSTGVQEPVYPFQNPPGSARGISPRAAAATYRRVHPVTTE